MSQESSSQTVDLSATRFLVGCGITAAILFGIGQTYVFPAWVIATELALTILGLFIFGSIRYRLDKNALTFGSGLIVVATFWGGWWPQHGLDGLLWFARHSLLSLHGWEELIHLDTMLFILGLTFFVSVIAQTRILETASFRILKANQGRIAPTVILIAGIVALASAILGGVSMVGLYIRTMVIILVLAHADEDSMIFAVIMATVLTTVSGVFLAYGEPPNLIMKANLKPYLDNRFFLIYGLPVAIGSYLIVAWNLKKHLGTRRVEIDQTDVLDRRQADVRFLQATRHGVVINSLELVELHQSDLGAAYLPIRTRVHQGTSIGVALLKENVPVALRLKMLGHYVSDNLSEALDAHFLHAVNGERVFKDSSEKQICDALDSMGVARLRSQKIAGVSFVTFVVFLIAHAFNEHIPLFVPPLAGLLVALIGIGPLKKVRALAFHEGVLEYKEYLFLFPLFFSITLLQKTGFFNGIQQLLEAGIHTLGISTVAYIQYWAATILSAILDNNIVADFASRALHGLELKVLHFFSMAQIAGYAVGGCWTHIGCAQSVVAYAFILKEINSRYTPWQWIKAMTVIILQISLLLTGLIYLGGWILTHLIK